MSEIFTKNPATYSVGSKGRKKKRKRIMRTFKIDEISSVDYGAQAPARAVLIKRAHEDEKGKKKKKGEMVEKMLVLTSLDEDHQHVLDIDMYAIKNGGGHTSYASGASDPEMHHGHDHPFVINADGSITIAADKGHSHTVDLGELASKLQLTAALADVEKKEVQKKIENQTEFVASDFALVPDVANPKTWKYRLVKRSGSNPDRRLVGNAVADLRKGRVPEEYSGTVIRRVRKAWLKAHPGKSRSDMPSVLKRTSVAL